MGRIFGREVSPITERRLSNFRANARGYWSFWIFLVLFVISLFAEFVANDKPVLVYYDGGFYMPIFKAYPETAFGGLFETEADYTDPAVKGFIGEKGWMIWPPVPYSHLTVAWDLPAPAPTPDARHLRPVTGGLLVQDPHGFVAQPADWRVVTQRTPTEAEWADAAFAWRVCGHVKSNAIVLAKDGVAWGIGAGQQNRVESGELAAKKAAGRAEGGACASDAFYPFPDAVEVCLDAGIRAFVQPGGSVRDAEVVGIADQHDATMLITGVRHFRH